MASYGTAAVDPTLFPSVAPTATTQNTIQPASATVTPLVIKGAASQSANLQEWQDSAGSVQASMMPGGYFKASILAVDSGAGNNAYNIGDGALRVIPRGVSGTGIVVRGLAGQSADLMAFQNSNAVRQLAVDSGGALQAYASDGTTVRFRVDPADSAAQRLLVQAQSASTIPLILRGAPGSQTGDYFQVQDGTSAVLARMLNTGGFATNNRITAGVSGAAVQTWGILSVSTNGASNVGAVVRGSASQTADLQQWQDSSGSTTAFVDTGGSFKAQIAGFGPTGWNPSGAIAQLAVQPSQASRVGSVVRGSASQTADLEQWQTSAGTVVAQINSAGRMTMFPGAAFGNAGGFSSNSTLLASGNLASAPVVIIRGAASQTADLQQWQDSAGAVQASISPSGGASYNSFISVVRQGVGGAMIQGQINTESQARVWHSIDGIQEFGDGTNPRDTRLSRTAAGTLTLQGIGSATATTLVAKGVASQSVNLQEWQDSTAGVRAYVDSTGAIHSRPTSATSGALTTAQGGDGFARWLVKGDGTQEWGIGSTTRDLQMGRSGAGTMLVQGINGATNTTLVLKEVAAQSGDPFQIQNSAGTIKAKIDANGYFSSFTGGIFYAGGAASVPLVARGAAGQTADLEQWQDSTGVVRAYMNSAGDSFRLRADATPTTASEIVVSGRGRLRYDTAGYVVLDDAGAQKQINLQSTLGGGAGVVVTPGTSTIANQTLLVAKGGVAQVSDMQQWQDSSGSSKLRVDSNGILRAQDFNGVRAMNTTNVQLDGTTYDNIANTPLSQAVWHDIFAFNRNATPTFETYNGTTWAVDPLDTSSLFAQQEDQALQLTDGTTKTGARWTWNSTNFQYATARWLLLAYTYISPSSSKDITLESSADGVTWTTRHTTVGDLGNAQPKFYYTNDNGSDQYIRLTIQVTNGRPLYMSSIRWYTPRWGNQGRGRELSLPYTWNASRQIGIGSGFINTSSSLTVQPGSASTIGVEVRAQSGQTADLLSLRDSAGTALAKVDSGGALTTTRVGVNSVIAANTMQRIVAQGAGYAPLVLMGAASQTADLQQWQDSAGTVKAWINSSGDITTNGTLTANWRLNALGSNATNVPMLVKGAAGQTANLQEWQDSTGTALAYMNSTGRLYAASVFPGGANLGANLSVTPGSASNVAAAVRGLAGQTANLQEWQDSAGTLTARISSGGSITTSGILSVGASNAGPPAGYQAWFNAPFATTVPLMARGAASQTGNLQEWQDSTGLILSRVDSGGSARFTRSFAGSAIGAPYMLGGVAQAATDVPILARGAASQSADLQQWQNSAGTGLAKIDASGNITARANGTDSVYVGSVAGFSAVQLGADILTFRGAAGAYGVQALGAVPTQLYVKATASQGATDLLQIQNSSAAALARFDSSGGLHVPALQVGTAATAGQVLTADASGNATWQAATGGASKAFSTMMS